jgi:DNA-binding CsgD family transcriptional regulator
MIQTVVIALSSYVSKRGFSAIIKDLGEIELVYLDELEEINHYLELNAVSAVIIDQALLKGKEKLELFFQLKKDTSYIAETTDAHCLPYGKKFDHLIDNKASKEKVIPVLESVLTSTKETKESSSILSERETAVLKLVALGYTNQEIAEKLFISKHTVISHRKNITSKLGIKTVSGLTVYAVLNNLIPKDQIK